MSPPVEHQVVIQRRGRSHRAWCRCGWKGHAWNELRPAEADAWHHVFGDTSIVDVTSVRDPGDPFSEPITALAETASPRDRALESARRSRVVDELVGHARSFADSPSPYRRQAIGELRRVAGDDRTNLVSAVSEIDELLRRHSRISAHTADSEWLQLITAKRLLQHTLEQEDLAGLK
ncbi:MAG TPA: hypothetical protein VFZ97_15920 [Acidimicrobiales bacterium]